MTTKEAIETLKANYPDACFGQLRDAVDMAIFALKQHEIIRCKDCKHYNAGFECLIEGYGIERNKDWFCADAERRTDETD